MFGALSTQRSFSSWDPAKSPAGVLSNANKTFLTTAGTGAGTGTILRCNSKTYIELTIDVVGTGVGIHVGVWNVGTNINANYLGGTIDSWAYNSLGSKATNGASSAYGAAFFTGDNIGIMYDGAAGTLEFRKNGTSQGVAYSGITTNLVIAASSDVFFNQVGCTINCGATAFVYSVPSGYNPGLY